MHMHTYVLNERHFVMKQDSLQQVMHTEYLQYLTGQMNTLLTGSSVQWQVRVLCVCVCVRAMNQYAYYNTKCP